MKRATLVLPLGLCLAATPLVGQSARPFSIQASALYAVLIGNAYRNLKSGPGAEVQVRRTFGRMSLGIGAEYTRHGLEDSGYLTSSPAVRRIGPFVEPRWVIPIASNAAAPYLAGRLSLVQVSVHDQAADVSEHATGFTLNGGGGVLVRLGPRVNLDLGATFGYTRFGNLTSSETTTPTPLGSGSNVILRTGIVVGL